MNFEHEGIVQIEVDDLKKIVQNKPKDTIIIDVREKEEYEAFHIPGIPLLPMRNFPSVIDKLKQDKEYILVCRSGNRSQHVARFLKEHGIEKAYNFYGGMLSWDAEVISGLENVITDLKKLYE